MSVSLVKAAISDAEQQAKEDCPAWLDMGQEGGLQVRWTFCKSVLSSQFLSHDMAKMQLPSISYEQGSPYAFSSMLQTACAFLSCDQMYTHDVMGYIF